MKLPHRRTGFTLLELLIVVGIVALAAVLFVPIALRLMEQNKVTSGIALMQEYLAQARARAMATGKAQGIRLTAMQPQERFVAGTGPALAWYDRVQFIEMPGDFCEGFVWSFMPPTPQTRLVSVPSWNNAAPETYAGIDPPTQVTTFEIVGTLAVDNPAIPNFPSGIPLVSTRLYGAVGGLNFGASAWPQFPGTPANQKQVFPFSFSPAQSLQPFAEVGDLVELTEIGQIYFVTAVQFNSGVVPTYLQLDRPLPHDIPMPLNGMPNYRVHRQPRPIPGTADVKLPASVLVDLTPSGGASNPMLPIANGGDRDANNLLWMRGVSRGISVSFPSPSTPSAIAPRYVDLVFDGSGNLIPMSRQFSNNEFFTVTAEGMVYLWMHPTDVPGSWFRGSPAAASGEADNQAIVSINARSGQISSYQVDHSAVSANPWADAVRGRASGLGRY